MSFLPITTLSQDLFDASLSVPLDTTLLQARVNTQGNILRDHISERLDVLSVDGFNTTESSRHNIGSQAKEALCDLVYTRVIRAKRSNEDSIGTVRVELLVNGSLRENCHLEGIHGVLDGTDAILENKVCNKTPLHDDVQLRGSVMNMCSIHAAGTEECNSHGAFIANKSGHS
ncbi:hypothetical protein HG530_013903 [Fusarium avenaceum]|nr:hypothetical protein HG530_013903 [Fusarium avenaceum]